MFRCSGADFDVDAFLAESAWTPCAVYRRGEPHVIRRRGLTSESGFNVVVSDFDDSLESQIHDALKFLAVSAREITRLRDYPGVEGICLDFGINPRDEAVQCEKFPAEFLETAGQLGVDLEISLYLEMASGEESN